MSRRPADRPAAPAIADRVAILTMLDPYLSLRAFVEVFRGVGASAADVHQRRAV